LIGKSVDIVKLVTAAFVVRTVCVSKLTHA